MKRKLQERLSLSFDAFLDRHDVDLRYIDGPAYVGPPLPDGWDIWGVARTEVTVEVDDGRESYQEVTRSPLAEVQSVEQVAAYTHWPSPDWFDYSVIEAQCDRIRGEGRVVVFVGDRLNRVAQLKPAMYLRGLEGLLTDMAAREEIVVAIIARIRAFYRGYLERILHAAGGKIDIVLTGDDFGSQGSLLISPAMWREYLRDGFAEYVDLIHAHGAKAMHHTCGSVAEVIPDLIACRLDVLQSLQPEAANMALEKLLVRFGDRLCFHGGISIQKTMPFGTPADVRREVGRIAELVKPGGGYIFCTAHNIQADTSIENVQALLAAYSEFGRL